MKLKNKQKGTYTVEFAVVGTLLFMTLFGVIEVARTLFTWNTLVEATRRGARIAAVCPINHVSIQQKTRDLMPDPTTGTVVVTYYDKDGSATTNPGSARSAKVEIQDYRHNFVVPFVDQILTAPKFETTIPTESLGFIVDCS